MKRRARDGFVLLTVLWVLVGLTALGLALSLVARRATASAANRVALARAQWRAEDCVARARAVIAEALEAEARGPTLERRAWRSLAAHLAGAVWLGGADDCAVSARAAGGALDENDLAVDDEMLRRLFTALRVPPAQVDSLVDALLDWRDADDLPRPLGAEEAWYVGQGRAPPRNGPLADVRELAQVRGFEALAGLDSVLAVEPGRVVLDLAPLPVLAALPGFTEEAIARVAEHRARGAPIPDLLGLSAELSPAARAELLARYPELVRLTTSEPDAWIVTSRARAGVPDVTAVLEVRLVRAGTRAAIVRRRTWVE